MSTPGYARTDLRSGVMQTLSAKLSTSALDLSKTLGVSLEELELVLETLEREDMIHRVSDSVTGEVLISPTSRGLLQFRKAAGRAL